MNTEDIGTYLEGLWVSPPYQLTFKSSLEGFSGELIGPNQFREILEMDSSFEVLKIRKGNQSTQIFYKTRFLTFVDPTSTHWHQLRFLTLETLGIVATNNTGQEVANLNFKRAL